MTQAGFAILEHPADIGIEAWGSNLAEAFSQASAGLISVILDADNVESRETRHIAISATDVEHLLVKWLTEILYLYDGQKFVGKVFAISRMSSTDLEATIHGESLDSTRHVTKLDVKAITYHQLMIAEEFASARIKVFLDI
jgi:SHS2 domain-containing protein